MDYWLPEQSFSNSEFYFKFLFWFKRRSSRKRIGTNFISFFIYDVVDLFSKDLNVKLYADDAKRHAAIRNINSVTVLQSELDELHGYWVSLSASVQCYILPIIRSYLIVSLRNAIETADLGIIVDHKLRFSSHYAYRSFVKRAHQRSSIILRCFKCRDTLLLAEAFLVYVRPLLEYCSPVRTPVTCLYYRHFTSWISTKEIH